jgi:hypothetical protein
VLIYILWHWPEPAVTEAEYEQRLQRFHGALAATRVPGARGSASYRVEGLPFLPNGRGYEDWYLVADFASLGELNTAAVAPGLQPHHDAAAAHAAGGTAGLYAVRFGALDLAASRVSWLDKPRGRAYDEFLAGLPAMQALLQRRLTFGPGSEFCALGEVDGALVVRRERLA